MALKKARVRIVTADSGDLGITDLFAQAIMNQSAKTFVEDQGKLGLRSARERLAAADAATGSSGG